MGALTLSGRPRREKNSRCEPQQQLHPAPRQAVVVSWADEVQVPGRNLQERSKSQRAFSYLLAWR